MHCQRTSCISPFPNGRHKHAAQGRRAGKALNSWERPGRMQRWRREGREALKGAGTAGCVMARAGVRSKKAPLSLQHLVEARTAGARAEARRRPHTHAATTREAKAPFSRPLGNLAGQTVQLAAGLRPLAVPVLAGEGRDPHTTRRRQTETPQAARRDVQTAGPRVTRHDTTRRSRTAAPKPAHSPTPPACQCLPQTGNPSPYAEPPWLQVAAGHTEAPP